MEHITLIGAIIYGVCFLGPFIILKIWEERK